MDCERVGWLDGAKTLHELVKLPPLFAILLSGDEQFFLLESVVFPSLAGNHVHIVTFALQLPAHNAFVHVKFGCVLDLEQGVRGKDYSVFVGVEDRGRCNNKLSPNPVFSIEAVNPVTYLIVPRVDHLVRPGNVTNIPFTSISEGR